MKIDCVACVAVSLQGDSRQVRGRQSRLPSHTGHEPVAYVVKRCIRREDVDKIASGLVKYSCLLVMLEDEVQREPYAVHFACDCHHAGMVHSIFMTDIFLIPLDVLITKVPDVSMSDAGLFVDVVVRLRYLGSRHVTLLHDDLCSHLRPTVLVRPIFHACRDAF
jgi:hypothetical protein